MGIFDSNTFTYFVLHDHKPVEIVKNMPDIKHVPVDTYVLCEYDDGTHNLFRSEFHMGRGGKSPWSLVGFDDHDIPGHVKAYLMLLGVV